MPDDLEIAAARRADRSTRLRQPGQQFLLRWAARRAEPKLATAIQRRNLVVQCCRKARNYPRKLDHRSDVIEEEDQYSDVSQRQHERHRDRQMRNKITVRAAAYRNQRDHRVAKRRDKCSQRNLSSRIAYEVAQHPRPELR